MYQSLLHPLRSTEQKSDHRKQAMKEKVIVKGLCDVQLVLLEVPNLELIPDVR